DEAYRLTLTRHRRSSSCTEPRAGPGVCRSGSKAQQALPRDGSFRSARPGYRIRDRASHGAKARGRPDLALLRLLPRPAIVRLAARAADDLVAEHELLRELVAREVFAGLREQIGCRGARAAAQLDDRDHLLAPALARPPCHHGVEHRRVVLERVLDLLREDL